MTQNIMVVKVIGSDYDPEIKMFRRKMVSASGHGYQFVRDVELDQHIVPTEQAVIHDLYTWLEQTSKRQRPVVPFAPKYDASRSINWLPDIEVASPTRHYWCPERQQVHTRIKSKNNETYNLFTPISVVRDTISDYQAFEDGVRKKAYGHLSADLLSLKQ